VGGEAKGASMIQRIKKEIGIAALFVGAAFTGALGYSYWTVRSWRDTPVFNLAFSGVTSTHIHTMVN
jgi:hypothetical protein